MTIGEQAAGRDRTAAVMHSTADQLEAVEATLHRSAEASPDESTRRRLHSLGDQVTAEAKAIDRRADRLAEESPVSGADQVGVDDDVVDVVAGAGVERAAARDQP